MDGYMTTKQAAEKWGVSIRQVQNYCKKGIIPNVVTVGTNYLIPDYTSKPQYGFYSAPQPSKSSE
ncbi:MAG: helix-turn-helix domain-containing protein [Clostridia bacterium]|nr:helix-turn-helix domain-containing protein [Clostridia bacterium]